MGKLCMLSDCAEESIAIVKGRISQTGQPTADIDVDVCLRHRVVLTGALKTSPPGMKVRTFRVISHNEYESK